LISVAPLLTLTAARAPGRAKLQRMYCTDKLRVASFPRTEVAQGNNPFYPVKATGSPSIGVYYARSTLQNQPGFLRIFGWCTVKRYETAFAVKTGIAFLF